VDWSQLAVDMTHWWTSLDMVVKLMVLQISGNFLVTWVRPSFFENTPLFWVIFVCCRTLFFYLTTCRKKSNVFMQRGFVLSTKSRLPPRKLSVFAFWINAASLFPGWRRGMSDGEIWPLVWNLLLSKGSAFLVHWFQLKEKKLALRTIF
jgi:hypothetical protein